MADLTAKTLTNGYPNLVTVGATTDDNPTSGQLENGKGNALTAVGIGTNSPSELLEIQSNGGSDSSNIPIFKLNNTFSGNYDASGQPIGAIEFASDDATSSLEGTRAKITSETRGTSGSTIDLAFYTSSVSSPVKRMVITGDGNVGIGTTSPAVELDVDGEIRASGGILFGTDTAAANALDDYEEGTWTPVYAPESGSFGTMTMDVQSATYTKIGRQVTVITRLQTDEVVLGTASGVLRISGLPFTNTGSNRSACYVGFARNFSNAPNSGFVNINDTTINLQKTDSTANSVVGDLTTGATADRNQLIITATYFV